MKLKEHLKVAEKPQKKMSSRFDRHRIMMIPSCQMKYPELVEENCLRERHFQLDVGRDDLETRIEGSPHRILLLDTLHTRRKVRVSRLVPHRHFDLRMVAAMTASRLSSFPKKVRSHHDSSWRHYGSRVLGLDIPEFAHAVAS